MKRSSQLSLLSVMKSAILRAGALFALLAFESAALAATPVDVYQDMESGNAGDVLTAAIMNASTHPSSPGWAAPSGTMWVSTKYHRNLPGPVTVGGTTYNGTGGSRTWVFSNYYNQTYVDPSWWGTPHSRLTVAYYYTSESTQRNTTGYDVVFVYGVDGTYAIMQNSNEDGAGPYLRCHSKTSAETGVSPNIKITPGKTYWCNLKYDGPGQLSSFALFDPDNSFAQVGSTVSTASTSDQIWTVWFGRSDQHQNTTSDQTQAWFGHILIDWTNAAFPLIPSAGTDTTPPSDPGSVRDGTGADISTTVSTTQLSANWDAASDAQSGISGYQYAVGTSAGGTQTVNFTSLGNVTTITKTGLTLTVGQTYYFSVKAVNGVGLTGSATNSNGQTVVTDSTPPGAPPAVRDGTGADISTTSSTTQLSANWDASTDNESGISGYQYAIGTSAGGTQTVNFTSLGNVTTVTKTGLTLTVGQTYYFSVKAVNGVGLTGSATNSNGQTVVSVSAAIYFQDNFESWAVHGGAWSSVSGENSTQALDTSTDYAMAGAKSLKLTDNDSTSTGACVTKTFSPAISGDLYVRFFMYLPTGFTSANTGCASRRMLRVFCGSNRGQWSLANGATPLMEEVGAWSATLASSALSENTWHCIEMYMASPSASTPMQYWIDGVSAGTLNGSFAGSSTYNRVELGNTSLGTGTNVSGTYYLDEVIVANYYIDPTPPSAPANVRDGTGADISTTSSTTQLSANWDAATDADSGISGYQYAIGTTAGGTQTVNWTSLGNVTTVTKTGLTLTVGQTYYVSVRSVNGAGLNSTGTNSNGQTVVSSAVTYFSDNFENWTVHGGAWSSVNGESSTHTLNTSTDHARSGTKSLKITDTDTTATAGAYLVENFSPTISGNIYVRFYVYLPTGYTSANAGGASRRLLRVWCQSNRGQMSLSNGATPLMEEVGAWGASLASSALSENAWHCVEMYSASPSASTAMQYWIDGTSAGTLNGSYGSSSTYNKIELGDVSIGGGTNDLGTFYLDEVIVSNAYNGPLP